jgi:hypothetical protein
MNKPHGLPKPPAAKTLRVSLPRHGCSSLPFCNLNTHLLAPTIASLSYLPSTRQTTTRPNNNNTPRTQTTRPTNNTARTPTIRPTTNNGNSGQMTTRGPPYYTQNITQYPYGGSSTRPTQTSRHTNESRNPVTRTATQGQGGGRSGSGDAILTAVLVGAVAGAALVAAATGRHRGGSGDCECDECRRR